MLNVLLTCFLDTVLVIEAGPLVDGPAEYATLLQPGNWFAAFQYLWFGINSEPNVGLGGRIEDVLNGKVVGGGSAVNGLNYNKDTAGQYDLWATIVGSNSWGWSKFLPFLKRVCILSFHVGFVLTYITG